MNILIAGGTGLIGSALTRSLLQNNDRITMISRTPDNIHAALNPIPWDIDRISQEIESTDIVINLAGASIAGSSPLSMRWTAKRKSLIRNSRIQAGKIIQKSIQNATRKPELLIQASAIGYYGNLGDQTATETSPPGIDFLADVCQVWEDSTSGVEELGVRRIVSRIGLVLSRDGGLLPLLSLPFRFYLGGPLGKGQQPMSWIHIDDVVRSYRYFITERSTQGIYNLTAPIPVQNQAFSTSLGNSIDRPVWLRIPTIAIKFLLGEASTLAIDGREVLPNRLLESGYEFLFRNINSALNDLSH